MAASGARAYPRAYPRWLLFGLGALCGATWLGAALLKSGALPVTRPYLPAWRSDALGAVLALSVPTLILLLLRSPHLPARRHARAFYGVEALLMVLLAIPALLPFSLPADLFSLPLRVPTLSLGVALAAVDPRVSELWRSRRNDGAGEWWERKDPNFSTAITASAGFGVVLLVVAVVAAQVVMSSSRCVGNQLACGNLLSGMALIIFWSGALMSALAGLCGAWLGYGLGARIAQWQRWR